MVWDQVSGDGYGTGVRLNKEAHDAWLLEQKLHWKFCEIPADIRELRANGSSDRRGRYIDVAKPFDLLSDFLDTEAYTADSWVFTEILANLDKPEYAYAGNAYAVDVLPDRVVVSFTIIDEHRDDPESIMVNKDEFRLLLVDWQRELKQ